MEGLAVALSLAKGDFISSYLIKGEIKSVSKGNQQPAIRPLTTLLYIFSFW